MKFVRNARPTPLHDALHARSVEFVENVVEQQNRGQCRMLFQKLKLCQSQCYGVGFALALRAGFAHGVFAQKQFNVVAVHTSCGVAYNEVALACGIEVFEHTPLVEVAFVEHSHTFSIAGNGIVVAHENGFKRFNPPLSCRMDVGGGGCHLMLHGFVEQRVAKFLLMMAFRCSTALV